MKKLPKTKKPSELRDRDSEVSLCVHKFRMLLHKLDILGYPSTFIDWSAFYYKYDDPKV